MSIDEALQAEKMRQRRMQESFGDMEFEMDVANRMGPLAKGNVDATTSNSVQVLGRGNYNLGGYYVPKDMEITPQTLRRYGRVPDTDKQGRNYTRNIPVGKPGEVTAIGTGATPDTFAHESRHRYAENEGMTILGGEEKWNRKQDLMSATNEKEWDRAVSLFKDLSTRNGKNADVKDWSKKAFDSVTGHRGFGLNDMLESEYQHNPGDFPNNNEYLTKKYKEANPIMGLLQFGELSDSNKRKTAKQHRLDNLYVGRRMKAEGKKWDNK